MLRNLNQTTFCIMGLKSNDILSPKMSRTLSVYCLEMKTRGSLVPADRFGCRAQTRWVAVLKGSMTEQRFDSGPAEWAHSFQLTPCALSQILLSVLWVRQRVVEEDQSVSTEHIQTHIASVCAAVTSIAFVEPKLNKTFKAVTNMTKQHAKHNICFRKKKLSLQN